MPIRYRCPGCHKLFSIATRMAGKVVPCPGCGFESEIPSAGEEPAAFPRSAPPAETPSPGQQQSLLANPLAPVSATSAPPYETPEGLAAGPREGEADAFREAPDRSKAPSVTGSPPGASFPAVEVPPDLTEVPPADSGADPVRDEPVLRPRAAAAAVVPKGGAAESEEYGWDEPEAGGGFGLKKRHSEVDEMDLTPMVDMTFLLLIFFMITASFSIQKSIEVPAPNPDSKGAAQSLLNPNDLEQNSLSVRIDSKNIIYIEDVPLRDRLKLVDALKAAMKTHRKTEIDLSAADEAYHETVVHVVNAANEAQVQKIRMLSHGGDD